MKTRTFAMIVGAGCLLVILFVGGLAALFLTVRGTVPRQVELAPTVQAVTRAPASGMAQAVLPTLTPASPRVMAVPATAALTQQTQLVPGDGTIVDLFQQVNPGVVHIEVLVSQFGQTGEGAGSGFVLDNQGHIVTNNHVVAQAQQVIVIFHDGYQAEAEIVGTDAYADLAVIRVADIPEGVHPLPLGDSDQVLPGENVIAIGSPFGLGNSLTAGIVSAVGRTIPSGETSFSIPQAIQTDAAINPGNSGGPLIDMAGHVIGVNAQIASGGTSANAGVGFAIPANVVRRVAPALIQSGSYEWPWLGVQGSSVSLFIQQANNLDTQQGAYIQSVVAGGPAADAGLRGSTGSRTVQSVEVPVGGDVIVGIDGRNVRDFAELLAEIAARSPGQTVALTVLRNGDEQQINVVLEPRPAQQP